MPSRVGIFDVKRDTSVAHSDLLASGAFDRASTASQHGFAILAIMLVTWLGFGRVAAQLGNQGDAWSYLAALDQSGPYSLINAQVGRLALPWGWALGYAIGHNSLVTYHILAACLIG